jgi:hypothetical protein
MTDEQMDRANLEADVIDAVRGLNDHNLSLVLELATELLQAQNGPDPNDTDDYLAYA